MAQTKPILITGGAGFLGANIAATLAERGDKVSIIDNLSRGRVEENLIWLRQRYGERISVEVGDVRDRRLVEAAVTGCRAVVHLAAQVAVTTSVEDPVDDFETNARGTLNVLEAVRLGAPDCPVLFASTNKVYGKLLDFGDLVVEGARYLPRNQELCSGFNEATPLSFCSPYGCSKGAADQYVLDYARVYGLKTCVFRMSCLYGPHQYGHEDQGWVAHFLISALARHAITIYGDGRQVRDLLYVDDAVRAYTMAIDAPDRFAGQAFNLGGGAGNALSLLELIAKIEAMTGEPVAHDFEDWRPSDQAWYVSDTSLIERSTAWKAQTPVDSGLVQLIDWLREWVVRTPERLSA